MTAAGNGMRVIFAGTPEFAARALEALNAAGHTIPLVLTQPDRPAGRGMKLRMSPVKEVALAHGLTIAQPENLKSDDARQPILDAHADVMVVAAYGLILPQTVLDMPRLGCINIHASLLPRWRGAAPIHRAIEAGDAETGITLMQMDKGLDTGAMLTRTALPIAPDDTTGSLHDKLAALGAQEIVTLLARMQIAPPKAEAQDEHQATYAHKISKAEAALDWQQPAAELARKVRAFNPFPGTHAEVEGVSLKIWAVNVTADNGMPGSRLDSGTDSLTIACGEGALRLEVVQKPGGSRQNVAEYLRGLRAQG